jgi:type IV secretion system protein VirB5
MMEKSMVSSPFRPVAAVGLAFFMAAPARAQLAVIDVPAIVQLVQEVEAMQQQVQTAQNQLIQARQALDSMTGARGMQLLLQGTVRNYLPSTWSELTGAMQGGSVIAGRLAADVRSAIAANGILTLAQLAGMSPINRQLLLAGRQSVALQQALVQESLSNASGRFLSLQRLIDAIGGAVDQKAVLDLQARIAAELAMLENERNKLQILDAATRTEYAINLQREREQAIAGHGSFAGRFQPRP